MENLGFIIRNDTLLKFSFLLILTGAGLLFEYKWRQSINNWYDNMPTYKAITIYGGIFLIIIGIELLILRLAFFFGFKLF